MSHYCPVHVLWFLFPWNFKSVYINLISLYTKTIFALFYESIGLELESPVYLSLFVFIVIQTSLMHRGFCNLVPFAILFNLLVNQLIFVDIN